MSNLVGGRDRNILFRFVQHRLHQSKSTKDLNCSTDKKRCTGMNGGTCMSFTGKRFYALSSKHYRKRHPNHRRSHNENLQLANPIWKSKPGTSSSNCSLFMPGILSCFSLSLTSRGRWWGRPLLSRSFCGGSPGHFIWRRRRGISVTNRLPRITRIAEKQRITRADSTWNWRPFYRLVNIVARTDGFHDVCWNGDWFEAMVEGGSGGMMSRTEFCVDLSVAKTASR